MATTSQGAEHGIGIYGGGRCRIACLAAQPILPPERQSGVAGGKEGAGHLDEPVVRLPLGDGRPRGTATNMAPCPWCP